MSDEARAEDQRRTVILFVPIPLKYMHLLFEQMTLLRQRLLDAAHTLRVVKKVTINRRTKNSAWPASELTVYILCREGLTDTEIRDAYWELVKFVALGPGEKPLSCRMANAIRAELQLKPCCYRKADKCPGELCAARNAAWAAASYSPHTNSAKRDYVSSADSSRAAAVTAQAQENKHVRSEQTNEALQRRLRLLCVDFQSGRVSTQPTCVRQRLDRT